MSIINIRIFVAKDVIFMSINYEQMYEYKEENMNYNKS